MSLRERGSSFDAVFEKVAESFEYLWRGTSALQITQTSKDVKDFEDFRFRFD